MSSSDDDEMPVRQAKQRINLSAYRYRLSKEEFEYVHGEPMDNTTISNTAS